MNKSIIEIDQSGKIEQTNLDTAVALTNGTSYTIFIDKREKRIIERSLRKKNKPQVQSPIIFAVVLALTIFESKIEKLILIDTEYPSYDRLIKRKIIEILTKMTVKNIPTIKFGFVGKESKSDYLASKTRLKKIKANKKIKAKEVLKYL